ncbi:MAG: glycosyltransferase N-terminal domain-containing protein [Flavobacteriales bacterium]|nr:glycosyltransferase N-terminal domain-containing protein [Flavobacteriales bacterium]
MRLVYSLGIQFYNFVVLIFSLFNKKAKDMIEGRKEVPKKSDSENEDLIWIHAASLGEFEQGRPIIEQIKKDYPNKKILLSFFSPSGYNIMKDYAEVDEVCYIPFDTRKKAKQFIERKNPALVIFIKYEFWFNFLIELNLKQIPVVFVSAIFREDQFFFKKRGNWFLNKLKKVDYFFVQNDKSKIILENNGIQNCSIAGDTRFDAVITNSNSDYQNDLINEFLLGKKSIIFGSTWEEDQALIVKLINSGKLGSKKIIIAPHEINSSKIEKLVETINIQVGRYSKKEVSSQVLIIDQIGILKYLYRFCDLAYIGGGFGVGIHNTLEAIVYKVPVIFGPNFKKFDEAINMINNGIGFYISNYEEFEARIIAFQKLDSQFDLTLKINKFITENKGAANVILEYLKKKKYL